MREKIHYLKFCMSCLAGQAGHLASPLIHMSANCEVQLMRGIVLIFSNFIKVYSFLRFNDCLRFGEKYRGQLTRKHLKRKNFPVYLDLSTQQFFPMNKTFLVDDRPTWQITL